MTEGDFPLLELRMVGLVVTTTIESLPFAYIKGGINGKAN